jgi:hypothetical protein
MERRIVSNAFLYTADTYKTDEVLVFTIIPNDYLKQSELGQRKLLMDMYDSKVYLEPLVAKGDKYWIGWSFDNNRYKREGTVFTFRSLLDNGLYTDSNPNFQAVNEDGRSIHGSYGGGGSTYTYGFDISKENFNKSKRINIRLEGFNLMHYKLRLF